MTSDFSVTLTATPTAPSEARAALRAWLQAQKCLDDQADVAQLLTSELVSNAVRHTPSDRITLSAAVKEDHLLHVGVGDSQPGHQPLRALAHPHEGRAGGRGLWLVEALAARWGWHRRPDGKEVWFEIPCAERLPDRR